MSNFVYISIILLLSHFPVCRLFSTDDEVLENGTKNSENVFSEVGPSCPNCGIRSRIRIVGGRDANIQEFPWLVTLTYFDVLVCAGSFINSHYVLTAAHCVHGKRAVMMKVVNMDVSMLTEIREREFLIQKIIVHQEFDPETFDYDIALLRLNETVHFNPSFKPLCMPFKRSTYENEVATVAGWGVTKEDATEQSPTQLHKLRVPVISNEACGNVSGLKPYVITRRMLCAGDPNGGEDACQGDSGGPLMLKNRGRWIQIGIVSWGVGCARPNTYGIYTRLTEFLDWIQENFEPPWGCSFS